MRARRRIAAGAALCLWAGAAAAGNFGVVTEGDGWVYTRLGNQTGVTTTTQGGVAFEGGGLDVAEVYRWMCRQSGNGDFLVIRSSGTADYNPYIARLCPGINSVATLKLKRRSASFDPFVAATISHAGALFIAGGNQADYVNFWQDTPVSAAINALTQRGVTVGGTSAGNAILAQFAFSALKNTVHSNEALADCYNKHITIDDGFLNLNPVLAGLITDDHFRARNRMGRLVVFLARIAQSGLAAYPRGLGLDQHTALLMQADGRGVVVGTGHVFALRAPGPPEVCAPATPVTFTDIPVMRLKPGDHFDIARWSGPAGEAYMLSAADGILSSTAKGGSIY